jgi:hypothetical protein
VRVLFLKWFFHRPRDKTKIETSRWRVFPVPAGDFMDEKGGETAGGYGLVKSDH